MRFMLTVLALLCLCDSVPAQCRSCGGAPVQINTQSVVTDKWFYSKDDPVCAFLESAIHPGRWDYMQSLWYPWDMMNKVYLSPVADAPVQLPPPTNEINEALRMRGGVIWGEIGKRSPYERNGVACSREQVMETIGASLKDESTKKHITVIARDEATRNAALARIGSPSWAVVKAYAADDWAVSHEYGFVNGGNPTVYIQEPDGTVIHRQDELDNLELAIRRADPSYDASRDPDLRAVSAPVLGVNSMVPFVAGLAVAGVVFVVLRFGKGIWAKITAPSQSALVQMQMLQMLKQIQESNKSVSSTPSGS
jgi:hypothetical protein